MTDDNILLTHIRGFIVKSGGLKRTWEATQQRDTIERGERTP